MIKSFKHKCLSELFETGRSQGVRQDLQSRCLRRLEALSLRLTMGEYYTKRPINRPPIHPGEILREDVLPALGLSVSEAAQRLGISRQQLHRVLAGTHPITTEMALRIGKFAGNGPGLWLRMQQAYDLWHAEQRMKDELSRIETAASA
jgi:antitoxin HigA-1